MKHFPEPVESAITAEVMRLKPRYEDYMRAQGLSPDEAQLHDWAVENLREKIILEEEAKDAKLSVEALMKRITSETPRVTIDEARTYFKAHPDQFVLPERVHARHIVLHRQEHEAGEATTTLMNLRSQIRQGKLTWEDAVKQHSSCSSNDDLGFFARGQMVQSFEDAAFAAKEGEITEVVESEFGWHLILVVAHLPQEEMLFDEARDGLVAHLQEDRDREALEHFVDERKACYKQA